jgi:hypothetical protein
MLFRTQRTKGYWAVAAFTAAYLVASGVAAAWTGNGEFVFYLVILLILAAGVAWIDRRVRFSMGVLWCLSMWGLIHMAGGLVPVPESWPIKGDQRVVYSWWIVAFQTAADGSVSYGLKYDQVTHAFGFGVIAWACWQGLLTSIRSAIERRDHEPLPVQPTLGRLTLCFFAAMGFGAANEIIEFVATTLGPTNVGGYVNTSYDLISNAVGALAAVLLIRVVPVRVT